MRMMSSKLDQIADLLKELVGDRPPAWLSVGDTRLDQGGVDAIDGSRSVDGIRQTVRSAADRTAGRADLDDTRQRRAPVLAEAGHHMDALDEPASVRNSTPMSEGVFRSDRLNRTVESMCLRAGFTGAVVADSTGLPLASFQAPFGGDVLSALSSVLGEALDRIADYLQVGRLHNMTVDVGHTDKLVLRKFDMEGRWYYLVILCGQETEERSEMELSIEQVRFDLSGR